MCYYLINLHNYDDLISRGVAGVMDVAGVAVALLQLLREVAAGVEKVDRRECRPWRRLHYYTKAGSRDKGLVAEGVT
jgi:hypothetical protein